MSTPFVIRRTLSGRHTRLHPDLRPSICPTYRIVGRKSRFVTMRKRRAAMRQAQPGHTADARKHRPAVDSPKDSARAERAWPRRSPRAIGRISFGRTTGPAACHLWRMNGEGRSRRTACRTVSRRAEARGRGDPRHLRCCRFEPASGSKDRPTKKPAATATGPSPAHGSARRTAVSRPRQAPGRDRRPCANQDSSRPGATACAASCDPCRPDRRALRAPAASTTCRPSPRGRGLRR